MGKNWKKFQLLMWKNYVLQKRSPWQTVIEIIAPIIFSVLIVSLPFSVTDHDITYYNKFDPETIGTNLDTELTIYYTPNDDSIKEIMQIFETHNFKIQGFDDVDSLINEYKFHESEVYAAIEFSSQSVNYDISIRFPAELRNASTTWRTDFVYPQYQLSGPRDRDSNEGAVPNYYRENFLFFQTTLYRALLLKNAGRTASDFNNSFEGIIEYLNSEYSLPTVNMVRFPYPEYIENNLIDAMMVFYGIVIMLSFVYTSINTVKAITTEKEKQLKEAMKIMGLTNWLHWTAWFVKTFIFLFISCVIITVLFKISFSESGALLKNADASVILIFFILYITSIIFLCFAVSVFFSKANTAATICGLIWFLSYTPYALLQNKYETLGLGSKLACSLGANSAMAYGFQLILGFEGTGDGIQWSNLFTPVTPDDDLTVGAIMLMLILDCIIYLGVAMYVENVFPGEFGVALPWNYPFTKSYWFPKSEKIDYSPTLENNNNDVFEKPPENLKVGVEIRNLRKEFGTNVAVNNLSLKMYENQITVLLGHNGAGKTTTMSMLTGMFPPTNGTAIVDGHDITHDMAGVRDSLGLCPQHNIIFDDLTVSEHLYFFSKLKGLEGDHVNNEIDKYIKLLELEPKRDALSKTLSGGMKRKLCVGMALCGNSKVIMLDEPTAGMDPSARRALWEFLQCQKEGRTMLLTTHFMDEADLLGDRIAIMAGGELQCCGSSFFLKKKFGAGYQLIMDKSQNCDSKQVTALLKSHISDIKMEGDVGSELTYSLGEEQCHLFENMLKDLEDNSQRLGIRSYGISLTTLEEVFMKVGADHLKDKNPPQIQESKDITINVNTATTLLTGTPLIINQIQAMFVKKMLSSIRSWIMLLLLIILPVIFLIIAMSTSQDFFVSDLPSLKLDLDMWSETHIYLQGEGKYMETYQKLICKDNCEEVSNILESSLEKRRASPSTFRYQYVVGAKLADDEVTAYFNNDAYHTPGVTLALILNLIYYNVTGNNVSFTNYPLPVKTETVLKQATEFGGEGFNLSFNIGFSMSFVSSIFILFIIRERITSSKHLQMVSGVKAIIFWLVTFIADYIVYYVMVVAFMITLICYQKDGFSSSADISRLFVIFTSYGIAMLPFMYWAAFLFDTPSTGYSRMTMFGVFAGVIAYMVIKIFVDLVLNKKDIVNGLTYIFLFVPQYSVITAIADSNTLYATNEKCSITNSSLPDFALYCSDYGDFYYRLEYPGIGRNLLYSFLSGFILLTALILYEYKVFSNLIYKFSNKYMKASPSQLQEEDADVLEEKERIRKQSESRLKDEYLFVMKDVTKYYKKFLAVNGLSLGAKGQECFGLLGVNGAGKTTTFKMMTGDIRMSYGDAWVKGYSIKSQLKDVQKHIGYCPQFDALLDDLTPRETIKMFALLRGIPKSECDQLAVQLATDFDFLKHIDKRVKELSGGNKRKLSTSIALIGDPPVIYLDEPTTGMDPATKRFLWNALCKIRDAGKLIILTSHSMEECEALCTRIAIMVNGNFKCLGSTQHLKNKFAMGFSLTVKIKKLDVSVGLNHSDTSQAEAFIVKHFPNAVLREKHQELITYYIKDKTIPWSKMFGIMERAKQDPNLNIEDYSLGQSSLEQVFLTFTKLQI